MFRINAFGQRVYCNPRLTFVDPPEGGNGGQGGDAGAAGGADNAGDKGYPENTAVADMTTDQQLAYHKYHSRKHEDRERELQRRQADYDKYKADSDELAQLKAQNATAEEKALEDARRDGENIGAARYLKEAVKGRFQGLTHKTSDEVDKIFAHVDALTFTDDKGDINVTALTEYAATFGTNDGNGTTEDPVAEALKRQRQAGGGSGSSISDRRKATRESMTRKTA